DVGIGHRDTLRLQLLDGLLDPLPHVAGRLAGRRAAAGAEATAPAATTTAVQAAAAGCVCGRRAGRGHRVVAALHVLLDQPHHLVDLVVRAVQESLDVVAGARGDSAGLLRVGGHDLRGARARHLRAVLARVDRVLLRLGRVRLLDRLAVGV